jgi:hypothetical protein
VPVLERDGAVFATDQPERSEQPISCRAINRRINLPADDQVLAKHNQLSIHLERVEVDAH